MHRICLWVLGGPWKCSLVNVVLGCNTPFVSVVAVRNPKYL